MTALIYLDNNATTRVADEVLLAMTPYYREAYGNPHSLHSLGRRAQEGVDTAREQVAGLLACPSTEVFFTSCGTEGNALVIRGLLEASPHRRKVVTTAVEHASVMALLLALESRGAITLAIIGVDGEGALDLDAMRREIDDSTLLVSVMCAQNETGVLHPVAQIAQLAHAAGALVHVDAVQAAGKLPIDTTALESDFVTISGHKFHAPKGIGALRARPGLPLQPLWYGGGQELGLRSGTEAVPSIVGMGAAADLARENLRNYARVGELRDRLEGALQRAGGASINGATQPRLLNTASIAFASPDVTEIIMALDAVGICVSGGSACSSGRTEPTATMKAMGKPASIRFSLSRYTTRDEIDRTILVMAEKLGASRGTP